MSLNRTRPTTRKSLTNNPLAPRDPKPPATLAQLTAQVEKRLQDWARNDVHARIEIGGLLRQVHARLDHGDWLEWVSERLPFTPRSVQKFIELHQWADRHAARFPKLAPLGSTKLYLLMRQPDALIIALLARAKHVIPSTGARKELVRMTIDELTEVVHAALGMPAPDAADVLLDSYRAKVRGVVQAMDALVEHRADIPVEPVAEMHDELLAAAAALSQAFKLDN